MAAVGLLFSMGARAHHPGRALFLVGCSLLLSVLALLRPSLLRPANRVWMALGDLMARFTNPVLMGLVFVAVITPFGFLKRRLAGSEIRAGFLKNADSYWIRREKRTTRESLGRLF
jgi:Saxitoxin biosynthesis operon protein SxtJ